MAPEEKKNQEQTEQTESTATPPPPPPHSWKALLIGLIVILAAIVACIAALRTYQNARPMDLRPATTALGSMVQDVLVSCQVPARNISHSAEKAYGDDQALWTHSEYHITVPPTLNVEGLRQVVEKEMTQRQVSVSDIEGQNAQNAVRLSLGGHPFADLYFDVQAPPPAPAPAESPCEAVRTAVDETIADLGLQVTSRTETDDMLHIVVEVATENVRWETAGRLADSLTRRECTIVWGAPEADKNTLTVSRNGQACVELTVINSGETVPPQESLKLESMMVDNPEETGAPNGKPKGTETSRPRVAIIVDDGGYGGETTDAFLAMDPNLTLSILPNTPHCADTAERGFEAGFEIMVHMPMENHEDSKPFKGQINVDMKPEQIQKLAQKAFDQIPHAVGTNNHTGSKFTADKAAMTAFLEQVKKDGLYFVDSRTTPDTVALDVARSLDIPCLPREVFLDHEGNGEFVRKQFARLVELAQKHGAALAICHFRANTAKTLVTLLPTLKEKGIDLVHVSEILP